MKHILRKEDYQTTRWSGGTTTQLAIYPEGAVYAERNFVWRISSAVVEDEYSSFTALPSVARIITPLAGSLELSHNGGAPFVLAPYETDCFWGDWNTVSRGKVTDFNLMMKSGTGRVESFSIAGGSAESICPAVLEDIASGGLDEFFPKMEYPFPGDMAVSELYYMSEGSEVIFREGTTEKLMRRGDALLFQNEMAAAPFELKNNSSEVCRWVHVTVVHPRS